MVLTDPAGGTAAPGLRDPGGAPARTLPPHHHGLRVLRFWDAGDADPGDVEAVPGGAVVGGVRGGAGPGRFVTRELQELVQVHVPVQLEGVVLLLGEAGRVALSSTHHLRLFTKHPVNKNIHRQQLRKENKPLTLTAEGQRSKLPSLFHHQRTEFYFLLLFLEE